MSHGHPTTLASVTARLRSQLMDVQSYAPIEGALSVHLVDKFVEVFNGLDSVRLQLEKAPGDTTFEKIESLSLSAIATPRRPIHCIMDLDQSILSIFLCLPLDRLAHPGREKESSKQMKRGE